MSEEKKTDLFKTLIEKGSLKQDVYNNTLEAFNYFRKACKEITTKYQKDHIASNKKVPVVYKDRGEFEFEMKFAGDILVFMMHTNVFEFPREHVVMKTSYVKEDTDRSYCGIISIYNFLADSFKYKRLNDLGYLIGRIFVNKDMHYFLEGKREIGLLYINFVNAIMTFEEARNIAESAMMYALNFDLLTPLYNNVKEVPVGSMLQYRDMMKLKTAKRLGFRFQADHEELDDDPESK